MPGETGWYVGLTGWFPTQQPAFNNGRASDGILTYPSNIRLMGTPKIAGGIEFGIAVGAHNTLRISGFRSVRHGRLYHPCGNLIAEPDLHRGHPRQHQLPPAQRQALL